jgi:hypothetical protein
MIETSLGLDSTRRFILSITRERMARYYHEIGQARYD